MTDPASRRRLEFWPDYGGVLLHEEGRTVALDGLGLPTDLVERARAWVAGYADSRLDPQMRDGPWIDEGRALFGELRTSLEPLGIDVFDWETTWG